MSRSSEVFVRDMLEAIERIEQYTQGVDFAQFARDPRTVDAVVRNLEVIGEAAKGVSATFRRKHTAIPWKRLAGLRDILIHHYFGVDLSIVWDVVQTKLPTLKAQLSAILESER